MRIIVKVKPRSFQERIEVIDQNNLIVWLKNPPVENQANLELIKLLAKHFKVAKTQIEIIKGEKSKNKIVKIEKS